MSQVVIVREGFKTNAMIVVEGLVKSGQGLDTIMTEVRTVETGYDAKHPLPKASSGYDIPDRVQCFTSVDPPENPDRFLWDLVVGGRYDLTKFPDEQASKNLVRDKWGIVMYDVLITPEWSKVGRDKGYADHKYVLYGGSDAGPLSFHMHVPAEQKPGTVYICEISGEFGATPKGFGNYRPSNEEKAPPPLTPEVYYTLDVPETDFRAKPFEFVAGKAVRVDYKVKREDFCMTLDKKVGPGNHVLTVVPTAANFMHIGYILMP